MRRMEQESGLDLIVNRERAQEPLLITPELETVLMKIKDLDILGFHRYDRQTRFREEQERHPSFQETQWLYARRLLAGMFFEDRQDSDKDAAYAYGRAGKQASNLARQDPNKGWRIIWKLRTMITQSRAADLYYDIGNTKEAFCSYAFAANATLDVLLPMAGSALERESVFGWSYVRLLHHAQRMAERAEECNEKNGREYIASALLGVYGVVRRHLAVVRPS